MISNDLDALCVAAIMLLNNLCEQLAAERGITAERDSIPPQMRRLTLDLLMDSNTTRLRIEEWLMCASLEKPGSLIAQVTAPLLPPPVPASKAGARGRGAYWGLGSNGTGNADKPHGARFQRLPTSSLQS
jgi:hypothetical protein